MSQVSPQEHHFWLKMLSEHGILIYDHLSPLEKRYYLAAEDFINEFAAMAREVAQRNAPPPLAQALDLCRRFLEYKLTLQRLRLDNEIQLSYQPTVFTGMISELEEYMRILTALEAGRDPSPGNVFHPLFLWLPDQLGHALLLSNDLAVTERPLNRRVQEFAAGFSELYFNSIQFAGMARAAGPDFPALRRHVEEVAKLVKAFYVLVQETDLLYRSDRLVSKITRVLLEHHYPESAYFLMKLGEALPMLSREQPELFVPPV